MIAKKEEVHTRWRDHFSHLLNPNRTQVDRPIELEGEEEEDPENPPTREEIKRMIQKLKNNKAPRMDGIPG